MTNYQKWNNYCARFWSPQSYIDFGFYWMICAALQRRVWFHSKDKPLYPNPFNLLVGPPATGKGLIITEVNSFLKEPRLLNPKMQQSDDAVKFLSENEKFIAMKMAEEQFKTTQEKEDNINKKIKVSEAPPLFGHGPDSATYQSLIVRMADCLRSISHPKTDPVTGKTTLGFYTHCSMFLCLEEMSSMFRKNMEELVYYLTKCWDCGDFTYYTISREMDSVRAPCLSIFAGTQETFMARILKDDLLNDGFGSRLVGIYEAKPRFVSFRLRDLTNEELEYSKDIKARLLRLSKLFGYCAFHQEVWDYMEWWVANKAHIRPNNSDKLNHYYSRKTTHIQKLAVGIHFAESDDMIIGLDSFKKAIEMLDDVELRMHLCLGTSDDSPLNKVTDKIYRFISRNGNKYTEDELIAEFYEHLPRPERRREDLRIVLQDLLTSKRIDIKPFINKKGATEMHYLGL